MSYVLMPASPTHHIVLHYVMFYYLVSEHIRLDIVSLFRNVHPGLAHRPVLFIAILSLTFHFSECFNLNFSRYLDLNPQP